MSAPRDSHADLLITLARMLPCHYPAKGDTCDDHRDFTPCEPCRVRRIAETTKKSTEPR